jgi:uncharacterized iron-regulated membrane protein
MSVHNIANDAANVIHAGHAWFEANQLKTLFAAWAVSVCGGLGYLHWKDHRPARPIRHSARYLKAEAEDKAAMAKLGLE